MALGQYVFGAITGLGNYHLCGSVLPKSVQFATPSDNIQTLSIPPLCIPQQHQNINMKSLIVFLAMFAFASAANFDIKIEPENEVVENGYPDALARLFVNGLNSAKVI